MGRNNQVRSVRRLLGLGMGVELNSYGDFFLELHDDSDDVDFTDFETCRRDFTENGQRQSKIGKSKWGMTALRFGEECADFEA